MRSFQRFKSSAATTMLAVIAGGVASNAQTQPAPKPNSTLVYVGTYTGEKSKGIYAFQFERQGAKLTPLGLAAETPNPSFVEIDAKRRLLFSVNESGEFLGKPGGGVSAFSINSTTGKLTLINQQSSMGKDPCHLVLAPSGKHLLVANYSSGNVAVLPVAPDGKLGVATDVIQHVGGSADPERQKGPHAHCVVFDPSGKFLFVCDLGLDKIMIYRLDSTKGKLLPNEPPFATVKAGAGPRHLVFRPDGRFAYAINELDSSITVFTYDASRGSLQAMQSISTLPAGWKGSNSTAEIEIHPSGKFLYGSNRGHNSVAIFSIDATKGTLAWVGAESTGGATPRHFEIDPAGGHMLMANQGSSTLQTASIDSGSGRLKPLGTLVDVPTPVCVKFLSAK